MGKALQSNNAHRLNPNTDIDIALTLICRYLRRGEVMTIEAIAEACGCSRQYIANIEKKAIKKLRVNSEVLALKEFLT